MSLKNFFFLFKDSVSSMFDRKGSLKSKRGMLTVLIDFRYRCNCLVIISVLGLSGYFYRANRLADKGKKIIEGSEEFRYTI